MAIQDEISRAFQLYEEKAYYDSKTIFEETLQSEMTNADEIQLRFGYGYPLSALGLVDEAVDNYIKLGMLGENTDNHEIVSQALHQIGMVYRESGQYQEAITYFLQEQKMIHTHFMENHLFIAANLYELGYTHLLDGNEDLAFTYLMESFIESQKAKDPIMQACVERGLGEFYVKQNNIEAAHDYYEASIQSFKEAEDEIGALEVVEMLNNIVGNKES